MALDRDIEPLLQHELLALLPREALRLIAFAAEPRSLRAGDLLFRKGEPADGGFLVTSGMIALDARDDGSPTTATAGPGALVGEMALFIETPRPATAVAREAASVLKLPRQLMLRVLAEFPEAAHALQQAIGARLSALSGEIEGVRRRMLAD